jgi:hypothetical protein
MKKTILTFLMITAIVSFIACGKSTSQQKDQSGISAGTVEVYYFHYTRRCATCQAVENVTNETLESYYAKELKDGKVVFKSVNLDEKSSEEIAAKFQVGMQTLLIVKGDQKTDMTDTGFKYARTEPDKLKQEIKSVIDKLFKS